MIVPVVAHKKRREAKENEEEPSRSKSDTNHRDAQVRGGARRYVNSVSLTAFFILIAATIGAAMAELPWLVAALLLFALLALFGIKIANQ